MLSIHGNAPTHENSSISWCFCVSQISPRTSLCWCRERALSCLWENEKRNFSRFSYFFPLFTFKHRECMHDLWQSKLSHRLPDGAREIIYHQSERLLFYRLHSSRTFLSTASHVLILPSFITNTNARRKFLDGRDENLMVFQNKIIFQLWLVKMSLWRSLRVSMVLLWRWWWWSHQNFHKIILRNRQKIGFLFDMLDAKPRNEKSHKHLFKCFKQRWWEYFYCYKNAKYHCENKEK